MSNISDEQEHADKVFVDSANKLYWIDAWEERKVVRVWKIVEEVPSNSLYYYWYYMVGLACNRVPNFDTKCINE